MGDRDERQRWEIEMGDRDGRLKRRERWKMKAGAGHGDRDGK